jgi:hypothetical protein
MAVGRRQLQATQRHGKQKAARGNAIWRKQAQASPTGKQPRATRTPLAHPDTPDPRNLAGSNSAPTQQPFNGQNASSP